MSRKQHIADIPVDGGSRVLSIDVYYDRGGGDVVTGQKRDRGYYFSIALVRPLRGGISIEDGKARVRGLLSRARKFSDQGLVQATNSLEGSSSYRDLLRKAKSANGCS